jgi:NAD(P)-dependent dehydrogenase (short-subunit alcohol dehydrogenase family)
MRSEEFIMTKQHPITSRFGLSSSSNDVISGIDLRGKTAIVTGGASGLGLETSRSLALAGATVIVPVRSFERAQSTLAGIDKVKIRSMDLSEPRSIDAFVSTILSATDTLDIIVAGAGIMAPPLQRDDRGYESQFAINHLGHFHLVTALLPALRRAPAARVVVLSSLAHRNAGVSLDDPNFLRTPYEKWQAYAQSKTANALFALELDRRERDSNVRAFSVHPGAIQTGLQRYLTDTDFLAFGMVKQPDGGWQPGEGGIAFKSTAQGAATAIWCATSPALEGEGGVYCEDCNIAVAMDADANEWRGVYPWATDAYSASQLWSLSEKLIGVHPS